VGAVFPEAGTLRVPSQSVEQPVGSGNPVGGHAHRRRDAGWSSDDAGFLAAIIDTQNDVAAVELDPATVMQVIVDRTRRLVAADGAVIKLVEGDWMVYRSACGSLAAHLGTRLPVAGTLWRRTSSVTYL
jgi:hypothetical protein